MIAVAGWTSLEIAKLVVAALTPVLVAVVGLWINRRLKSLEAAQWTRQKIVERRIVAYDDLATPLNRLFCYFAYVGSWKETTPPDVVALKRVLDQRAHISAPLFDSDFLPVYNGFIDRCFATFGSWGEDARLRTHIDRRRDAMGGSWDRHWEACFAEPGNLSTPEEVRTAYADVMRYLASTMGATEVGAHMIGSSRLPINY